MKGRESRTAWVHHVDANNSFDYLCGGEVSTAADVPIAA